MKVSPRGKRGFEPIDVVFTFESEEEVYIMYALFNHCAICDLVEDHGICHETVRDGLELAMGLCSDEMDKRTERHYSKIVNTITRRDNDNLTID